MADPIDPATNCFHVHGVTGIIDLGPRPDGTPCTITVEAGEDVHNGTHQENAVGLMFSPTDIPEDARGLPAAYEMDPTQAAALAVAVYKALDHIGRRRTLNQIQRLNDLGPDGY